MNSELYNKTYKLPSEVLKHLQVTLTSYPHGNGVKRAKFLLKNGVVTYQTLKRLKNFFDHFSDNDDKKQYELAGGDLMKSFVETTLNSNRDAVKRSDDIKRDINVDPNLGVKTQKTPQLNENEENNDLNKNAICIIVNEANQILLLKRNPNIKTWQAGKWALVGGGIENRETPEEACKREIKEETGLIINSFKEKFNIQRNADNVEFVFIAKNTNNDIHDIKLNVEHINYGWFFPEEMKFLDHVPNLMDYINIAFKNYD